MDIFVIKIYLSLLSHCHQNQEENQNYVIIFLRSGITITLSFVGHSILF